MPSKIGQLRRPTMAGAEVKDGMEQTFNETDVLPLDRPALDTVSPAIRPGPGDPGARAAMLARRAAIERGTIASTPLGERPRSPMPEPVKAAIRLGLKSVGLWSRGMANARDVRLHGIELALAGLPAGFDGYRVLQISDPHFDMGPGMAGAIIAAVDGVQADLCVLTGDFRDADEPTFTEFEILEPLAAITQAVAAPDGFLAVLGNHDAAAMVPHIEDLGIRVLINETIELERGGSVLRVTGLDDVHEFYTPAAAAALAAHEPGEEGRIALVHSPEMAGEAAAAGYALYLAGHCHGGQICLPGGRPVITHLLRHKDLHTGLWRLGGMTGYTSPGAGVCGLPVRYNCRGEVTLFTLRCGARSDRARRR